MHQYKRQNCFIIATLCYYFLEKNHHLLVYVRKRNTFRHMKRFSLSLLLHTHLTRRSNFQHKKHPTQTATSNYPPLFLPPVLYSLDHTSPREQRNTASAWRPAILRSFPSMPCTSRDAQDGGRLLTVERDGRGYLL